jgi:UDP-hydrolysing UDP-N-acetyl-D-glucosamine 2-epimerase
MKKNKICIVTAARSEYGLLRWLMEEIKNDPELHLQIVVTGSHLSSAFGFTYKEVENDGFIIDAKVDMQLSVKSQKEIAESMGRCAIGLSQVFDQLKPNIVVVLGDRYELLPICSTALIMNIPIAHISGGDITEGSIDNQIRNAISSLAHYHFPGTKESEDRLIKMGINSQYVFMSGEPGLDNFKRLNSKTRDQLATELKLDRTKKWVLMTYHPETKKSLASNLITFNFIIEALSNFVDIQVIMTYSNADFGGDEINRTIEQVCSKNPQHFISKQNLGQLSYGSLMKQSYFMIGNSSSGIVEAPIVPTPVINIGNRQKGRYMSKNVLNADESLSSIIDAIQTIELQSYKETLFADYYYGDGQSSITIKERLKQILTEEENCKLIE